ncbi:helix-turn-helix transcriptional regulator [Streptomyces marispadix]|uniref:helix-turn-helix transcriptional regulator n=1 Tax=Streptomyces marispadix TaxID=2922868 RepID=UPI0035573DFA
MNTPGMARLRAMRLAKDAMDRDWSDPDLDLDAVAAHAGYSRYHFVRAFKATYGESPGQYLSRRRIERAEELLRSANLSVTEICMSVGFTSLGTFSARFKKQTGTSPSDYRRRHGRRGAAMIPGCYAMLFTGGFKEPGTAAPEPQSGARGVERRPGDAPSDVEHSGEDRRGEVGRREARRGEVRNNGEAPRKPL